jgi:hypothetical protein
MLGVVTDAPVYCCKNGYKIGYLIEKKVKIREYLWRRGRSCGAW